MMLHDGKNTFKSSLTFLDASYVTTYDYGYVVVSDYLAMEVVSRVNLSKELVQVACRYTYKKYISIISIYIN